MKLGTKVFYLCPSYYRNLSELAEAMGISVSEVYRVRNGKRSINEKFIVGALSAFPQFSFDELFYMSPELVIGDTPSPAGATSDRRQERDAYSMAQDETQSPAALTADAARLKVSEFRRMMAVEKEPSSQIRTSRSLGEGGRINGDNKATEILVDGQIVTVDSMRGEVYQGNTLIV